MWLKGAVKSLVHKVTVEQRFWINQWISLVPRAFSFEIGRGVGICRFHQPICMCFRMNELVWTGENKTKTLMWSKIFRFVFVETKTVLLNSWCSFLWHAIFSRHTRWPKRKTDSSLCSPVSTDRLVKSIWSCTQYYSYTKTIIALLYLFTYFLSTKWR